MPRAAWVFINQNKQNNEEDKNMLQKLWKMKNKKGFTLIEMIVVIAIIAILIAMVAPSITKYINTAKVTKANGAAKSVYTAAQAYIAEETLKGNTVTEVTDTQALAFLDNTQGVVIKSITISGGAVTEVTLTVDGIEGTYPLN